jgi:hypothetical protein
MSDCKSNTIELCKVTRGDTWEGFTFQILDDDFVPVSVVNISEVRIQFKRSPLQSTADFEYRLSTNSILLVGTEFKLIPLLLNFAVGLYFFDVQVEYLSGSIKTLFNGSINIVQDVTR